MGLLALALLCVPPQEDLTCLDGKGASALGDYLLREIRANYDKRRIRIQKLLDFPEGLPHGVTFYAGLTRKLYRSILGPLPKKTPLNARVVGTINGDGCRIEKVVFESRPRHYVTANLYVPSKGEPPFPGVAVACGHSAHGKSYEAYQSVCVLLAKNGFVVLIYDPFGQGERRQLRGGPGNSGMQHKLCNVNSLPVDRHAVHYQAWDGVRALDYLQSRPEVDRSKPLGMTGNSGGGAQTIHLMVLDDRIGPAAPSCHVTTIENEFNRGAPGDGCQTVPYTGAGLPIDHPDFFTMRAPKPTIILSAEKDYKDIRFTRKTFAEAKAVYKMLGAGDRMDMFAFDDRHAFSRPRREAATRWMRRWLLDDPSPVSEPELKLQTREALQVTKSGETYKEYEDMLTIPDLNLGREMELRDVRKKYWAETPPEERLKDIRRLINAGGSRGDLDVESNGTIRRKGYRIEKQVLLSEGQVALPALLFVPDGAKNAPVTIYLDGRGKAADAAPGGPIEKLVRKGHRVLSIDARGWGETRFPEGRAQHARGEHAVAMMALHLARPLLGQRVDDVLIAADSVASKDAPPSSLHLVGVGVGGPVALHAAALDDRFKSVTIRNSIRSWAEDVVAKPLNGDAIGLVVPGSQRVYDLPDLVALLGDRLRVDSE